MTNPILEVRFEEANKNPPVMSFCPDYEDSTWRSEALARDIIRRHLASFALSFNQYSKINGDNAAESLSQAAKIIYSTDKYSKRGEFGEIILYGLLRDFIGSLPIVSKIYFKDGPNETVKGFDAVHFKKNNDNEIELLLGESKFYKDAKEAIRNVVAEINDHLQPDYLRSEFLAITNKLPEASDEEFKLIRNLLNENTSLDRIISKITIPIFITYDSQVITNFTTVNDQFNQAFALEVAGYRDHLEKN
ncbi:DUF1837 domain-containing protein [Rothia sp. P5764]|uniref:HamA C-terminal domain-containing protein n=1 Tax=Rothia sp. P5764 TaxID=3402654 RepID=UPI003AC62F71